VTLTVTLTVAACVSAPPAKVAPEPQATRAEAKPSEAVSALRGMPLGGQGGLYRLAFHHMAVSSCSQTFDISTTRGNVSLDLRRAQRASLTVERGVESRGTDRSTRKRYRYAGRVERCRWSGAVRRAPSGLIVDLVRDAASGFICSWDGMVGNAKTPERFAITCKPEDHVVEVVRPHGAAPAAAAARTLPLLSCALGQRVPRALTEATLDGALLLSREHRLRLKRSEGDDLILGNTRVLQLLRD
jgi:hypothetical protein